MKHINISLWITSLPHKNCIKVTLHKLHSLSLGLIKTQQTILNQKKRNWTQTLILEYLFVQHVVNNQFFFIKWSKIEISKLPWYVYNKKTLEKLQFYRMVHMLQRHLLFLFVFVFLFWLIILREVYNYLAASLLIYLSCG